ncbi:MAG: hypothetical protein LBU65_12680, partial [Planctomycetaceae bacterium]|nr:hypothetical protein [Planctomycetaceae bacterium]
MNTSPPVQQPNFCFTKNFKPFSPNPIPLAITQVPVTSSTRCLILGDDFLFTAIRKLGNETLQHKLQ